MIVGVGGQGTLLTSRIIGKTALENGYDVKISEVHGMAQRGGSVVTYVRFGEKVYEPTVEVGSADVLLAFERLEGLRYAHYLKKDGVIVVKDCRIDTMTVTVGVAEYPTDALEKLQDEHPVYAVDGDGVARALGNPKVVNSVVLGVAARFMGFEKEKWIEVLKSTVPPKTVDINVAAFDAGYESLETETK